VPFGSKNPGSVVGRTYISTSLEQAAGGRDWSAQEINHILFEIPLTSSSRDVVMLDCREEKDRPAYGEMDEDGIKIIRSKYTRYMDRKRMLSSSRRILE
jgi:hypothetical protein